MKKLRLRQAILNAIDETDPNLARYEGLAMKWGRYVEKEIGSLNAYPRAGKKYDVTGSTIELPDNALQVLAVVFGDYEDDINVYYRTVNQSLINVTEQEDYLDGIDREFIWQSLDATYVNALFWEQVGNELNLVSTFEATEITVIYNYMEKDDQGYYLVNDSHIDAITKYIVFMFAKKHQWNYFKSEKLMRSTAIQFVGKLEIDYHTAVRNARAEDGRETPFETEQYK